MSGVRQEERVQSGMAWAMERLGSMDANPMGATTGVLRLPLCTGASRAYGLWNARSVSLRAGVGHEKVKQQATTFILRQR